jgi:hypothetical protein
MSHKFNIALFAGDEANSNSIYRDQWRPALIAELSRHAFPVHPHGLLGFALGAIEYLTFDPNPFVAIDRPDQPAPGATASAWSLYNDNNANYAKQEQAKALAAGSITSNLGTAPLELIRDPVTRRFQTDLATILQVLDQHYLVVTRQELLDGRNALLVRYNPTKDFKAHLGKHRQLHNTFAHSLQPLSELDKIQFLVSSVDFDSEVKAAVQMYFTAVPNLAQQTFQGLAGRLTLLMANRPSAGVNEFANAATTPPSHGSGVRHQRDLVAENEELRKELRDLKRSLKPKRPNRYCWSHGLCGHDSSYCRQPHPGHKNSATATDKMGGKGSENE